MQTYADAVFDCPKLPGLCKEVRLDLDFREMEPLRPLIMLLLLLR